MCWFPRAGSLLPFWGLNSLADALFVLLLREGEEMTGSYDQSVSDRDHFVRREAK